MKKINKLILPATILLAAIILGSFIYVSQVSKQKSIEKQQEIKLQEDRRIEEVRAEQEKEKVEKDKADATFSNNLKCQTLLENLKQRWGNVVGIYYSEWQNTCIVKYTEKGETQEAPIETMQDTK